MNSFIYAMVVHYILWNGMMVRCLIYFSTYLYFYTLEKHRSDRPWFPPRTWAVIAYFFPLKILNEPKLDCNSCSMPKCWLQESSLRTWMYIYLSIPLKAYICVIFFSWVFFNVSPWILSLSLSLSLYIYIHFEMHHSCLPSLSLVVECFTKKLTDINIF